MSFATLVGDARRTVRTPPNPLDVSTIISIYPRRIVETKLTLYPSVFVIEPGRYDAPSVTHIAPSSWWKDVGFEQPLLEIPVPSLQLAESIIRDYTNGLVGANAGDSKPGLFFVPGRKSVEEIKKECKKELDAAHTHQKTWFTHLARMADALWARSNGNPLVVMDDMRLAAQELQLKNKSWMEDFTTLELTNCPACGFLRNSNFPVCSNCKTILDRKRFDALGLEMAK